MNAVCNGYKSYFVVWVYVSDSRSFYVAIFLRSINQNEPPLVHTAANLFRNRCYDYRDSLLAGIIVGGWDKEKGGQVREDLKGHTMWGQMS